MLPGGFLTSLLLIPFAVAAFFSLDAHPVFVLLIFLCLFGGGAFFGWRNGKIKNRKAAANI